MVESYTITSIPLSLVECLISCLDGLFGNRKIVDQSDAGTQGNLKTVIPCPEHEFGKTLTYGFDEFHRHRRLTIGQNQQKLFPTLTPDHIRLTQPVAQ